jgi:hypothetical protein
MEAHAVRLGGASLYPAGRSGLVGCILNRQDHQYHCWSGHQGQGGDGVLRIMRWRTVSYFVSGMPHLCPHYLCSSIPIIAPRGARDVRGGLAPDQQMQADLLAGNSHRSWGTCSVRAMNMHRLQCLQPQPTTTVPIITGPFGGLAKSRG